MGDVITFRPKRLPAALKYHILTYDEIADTYSQFAKEHRKIGREFGALAKAYTKLALELEQVMRGGH